MTDSDVTELIDNFRKKIQGEGLDAKYLTRQSGVSYNTVKNFLAGSTEPDFRTVIKLADAAGFSVFEIFGKKTTVTVEVDNDDNKYLRKYKRLNTMYQEIIKKDILAYTALHEKENKNDKKDLEPDSD